MAAPLRPPLRRKWRPTGRCAPRGHGSRSLIQLAARSPIDPNSKSVSNSGAPRRERRTARTTRSRARRADRRQKTPGPGPAPAPAPAPARPTASGPLPHRSRRWRAHLRMCVQMRLQAERGVDIQRHWVQAFTGQVRNAVRRRRRGPLSWRLGCARPSHGSGEVRLAAPLRRLVERRGPHRRQLRQGHLDGRSEHRLWVGGGGSEIASAMARSGTWQTGSRGKRSTSSPSGFRPRADRRSAGDLQSAGKARHALLSALKFANRSVVHICR